MLSKELIKQLERLISKTDLEVNSKQINLLSEYVLLLKKWNKAYNLTSIKNENDMLIKHIMDSLVVSSFLQGENFIDVGTGPGLPGIPLSIINPNRTFFLLDSLGKRTRFLNHVKGTLNIKNINIVQSRVEKFIPDIKFDGVLSRAFTSIPNMLELCNHLIDTKGFFYALKGNIDEEEVSKIDSSYIVTDIFPLKVPDLNASRSLVKLKKQKLLKGV